MKRIERIFKVQGHMLVLIERGRTYKLNETQKNVIGENDML